jgi:hypothetical protein
MARLGADLCAFAAAFDDLQIALAASPWPTHRDFVPWRFSNAGHLSAWIGLYAGIRKHAQEETSSRIDFVPLLHNEQVM